ncbi:uncharacterized protein N7482_001577 [Penicillium canariense]|uniref:CENP-V/GFA domain-containing protein n=1 Tax=Penicillium canariense TaxID=189055 RepID=A0A9W9LTP2_9EURO|nr:uncharacterized protein N7482_001577 [Penicillium canariense]KAJ5175700.1 hypothetical protein N7482_001577 [Penicillium canariense]
MTEESLAHVDGQEKKIFTARCHCESIVFTFFIPTPDTPLSAYLCHCSICRSSTGTLAICHAVLPAGERPVFIGSSGVHNLTEYVPIGRSGRYDFRFCSTCGAHVASTEIATGDWIVSTSIVTDEDARHIRFTEQFFTKSAQDGGISSLIKIIGNTELETWNPEEESTQASITEDAESQAADPEALRLQCHCGGVNAKIMRPSNVELSIGTSNSSTRKWPATLDIGRDSRLVNGCHITGWVRLPLTACVPAIGRDLKIGTAKAYQLSDTAVHSFCGICGATLMSLDSSDGDDITLLATGTLKATEGAMAREWLCWSPEIKGYLDTADFDPDFGEAVKTGMEQWASQDS